MRSQKPQPLDSLAVKSLDVSKLRGCMPYRMASVLPLLMGHFLATACAAAHMLFGSVVHRSVTR